METNEKKVGQVTHFFAGPNAAVLKLSAPLKVGDTIHIVGFTTDLTEKLTSMQIDHSSVQQANPGDDVAILVQDRVREGDEVFLVDLNAPVAPAATPAAPKPVAAAPALAATATPKPAPAAAKPTAKPKAKPKAKKKDKPKAKPKAKAKPKKKDKSKSKAKAKPKSKSKAKAKPKKKSKR